MKTNYKATDIVTISKPGLFNGFSGEVLGNNPNIKNSLSVMVNLSSGGILWNFSYCDILQTKDNASQPTKTSDTPKQTVDSKELIVKPEKRPYKKRDKTEVKVTKRKYNKKPKS